jgi:MGT family glycosyltransferase
MGRAVFLNVSGGGHVIATYGLVAELVRRGEEVIYYEVPHFKEDIEALGATYRPMPPISPYQGALCGYPFHHELDLAVILTWSALELIPKLIDEIRELKPDYIVHDSLCLWGKIIAQRLGIPAACSIHTPAVNLRSVLASGRLWKDMPSMLRRSYRSMKGFCELEKSLRSSYGLKRLSFLETISNPQPVNICHTPRELQPHGEWFGSSYYFVGSVHTRPNQEKSHFPVDRLAEKIIYIGFGTICDPGPAFFRNCVTAFRGLDCQVVMILSHSTVPEDLGEIPDNFIVWSLRLDGLAPQLDILPRASLFVMNGGMGGARESAWHGVPMLAIPTTFETYTISQRIQEQGAGRALPPDAPPESLRQSALAVLADPAYQTNSRRIGEACRTAGGAVRAADVILDYAARHGASQSTQARGFQ